MPILNVALHRSHSDSVLSGDVLTINPRTYVHTFFANDFKIKTIKYILKCKFLTTICTPAQNKEKNERTRQEQLSVSLAELRCLKTLLLLQNN